MTWTPYKAAFADVVESVLAHAVHGFMWETPSGLLCDPPVWYPRGVTESQVKRALAKLRKMGVVRYVRPMKSTIDEPGGWSVNQRFHWHLERLTAPLECPCSDCKSGRDRRAAREEIEENGDINGDGIVRR